MALLLQFLPQYLVGSPPDPDPVVTACEELGRVTRAYVSAYQRTRAHESNLVRGERRCLVADFNGAIPASRSIASVTWRTNQPQSAILSDARITGRCAEVNLLAGWGSAGVKCDVVLDNGEVYNQLFRILVRSGPWFQGDISPQSGPQTLTATA